MSGSVAPENEKGQSGIVRAALFGLCPHCSARTVFEAPAMVADHCRACGHRLAEMERGGRLVGLLTIAVAAVLITAAMALEEFVRPPLWLQVVFWTPVTIGAVLFTLRLTKIAGLYAEYEKRQNAEPERETE
ncbi:MAG: DUF983 domain-containing protein [Pseudomonadota bacterium]